MNKQLITLSILIVVTSALLAQRIKHLSKNAFFNLYTLCTTKTMIVSVGKGLNFMIPWILSKPEKEILNMPVQS